MGHLDSMKDYRAYWNPNKFCWEIWLEEAQGDRYVKVFKHADIGHKMLKEQGIKFIDAYVDINNKRPMLLISDPGYWLENENNIISWAKDSDIIYLQEGMILSFNSNEDKMMRSEEHTSELQSH